MTGGKTVDLGTAGETIDEEEGPSSVCLLGRLSIAAIVTAFDSSAKSAA